MDDDHAEQERLLRPRNSYTNMQNLIGLITTLSQSTSDRSELSKADIARWAKMYQDFLMIEREATIDEVFAVCNDWLGTSRFFPTVADLAPLVEQRVIARREVAMRSAAQREAVALPELPSGDVDWSKVRTADLPPGYDYSQDPDWQRGMDALAPVLDGKPAPPGSLAALVADIARRREANASLGFQGAAKAREIACPDCAGARYLRIGGWDGHPDQIAKPGSNYVMCRTCCPNGRYSEQAERDARETICHETISVGMRAMVKLGPTKRMGQRCANIPARANGKSVPMDSQFTPYPLIIVDDALCRRFWSKVDIRRANECWYWHAACTSNGYGGFQMKDRFYRAHRVAWQMTHGTIPREAISTSLM